MWYVTAKKKPDWSTAVKYLTGRPGSREDGSAKVGPCGIVPRRDYYTVLCVAIFNQQISTKIATILYNRFPRPVPAEASPIQSSCSIFSSAIQSWPRNVASRGRSAAISSTSLNISLTSTSPSCKLARMTDDEVIECLTKVKGNFRPLGTRARNVP